MISLDRVGKHYPGAAAPAVTELSLDVAAGEMIVLVGPSGCGKTTTLKMVNRLIEPTGGRITVAGDDIMTVPAHELRRKIGYVIQQIGLFPHRTIEENIATVPRMLGWGRDRIRERTEELISLVDLEPEMRNRYPAELSGGQRQRVGVARALAADPPVMLMDEPFGAVDPIVRARLQDELLDLQARVHKTIVLVTHDVDEAIKLGDRVAILNMGGILEQYDTPAEILRNPAGPFVEDFLGSDRGLKRLSLITIGQVTLGRGPVVNRGAGPAEARRVMELHGVDWFGVAEDDRLLGWAPAEALAGLPDVSRVPLHPFSTRLGPGNTLREALDEIVSGRTRVAPVFGEGDRFMGMLTAPEIADQIAG